MTTIRCGTDVFLARPMLRAGIRYLSKVRIGDTSLDDVKDTHDCLQVLKYALRELDESNDVLRQIEFDEAGDITDGATDDEK